MSQTHSYDFCVVGAGSAGYAAATTARTLGRSVIIAESTAPLAGLCILRGCMPSKTLLRSAEIAHAVATAADLGIKAGPFEVDFPAVMARKHRIIKDFADFRIQGIGTFPIVRGEVRFTGDRELRVGEDLVRASKYLIATGSVVNLPEIPGLAETGYLTSDDVLELGALPKSVLVLGGGPVACELAQYLRRLGVGVTLLQRSKTLLSGEDPDVGQALADALAGEGITVRTGVSLKRIERSAVDKRAVFDDGGRQAMAEAAEIFLALGRRANVDGLQLEAASVEVHRRGVRVNAQLQTSNPDIYAAGDVVYDSKQLVHVAVCEGQVAARNALTGAGKSINYDLQNARAVFTDPQVGVAGLTERQCRQRGIAYDVARFPFDDLGKGIATNQTKGYVKMLAAPDGAILGVAVVGAEASDLIHEAIALLYFKAKVHDVLEMPHLHPTLAEIMTYPAEELCERLEHIEHVLVTP